MNLGDWFFAADGLVFGSMIFTVEDLHRLRAGHGQIVVAELAQIVADAIMWRCYGRQSITVSLSPNKMWGLLHQKSTIFCF